MKTLSVDLGAHLAGEVTTLARCWAITRADGQAFYFTEHDRDLVVDGHTYRSTAGFSASALANDASYSATELEVLGILSDDAIKEEELRAGFFDYAEVRIFAVNWAALSQGKLRLRRGRLGEVTITGQGVYRAELRGLTQALAQQIGGHYQPTCRADLGDPQCKVIIRPAEIARSTAYEAGEVVRAFNLVDGLPDYGDVYLECTAAGTTDADAPTFDLAVDGTTTDGTVTWTARNAYLRAGVVASVIDARTFTVTLTEPRAADGWFSFGGLTWLAGAANVGTTELKAWAHGTGGGTVTFYLPAPRQVQVGDRFEIYPGCAKRIIEDCKGKFDNVINFRGEPYLPGLDVALSYPDAH